MDRKLSICFSILFVYWIFCIVCTKKILLSPGYYLIGNKITGWCTFYDIKFNVAVAGIDDWMETERYLYGYRCVVGNYIYDKFTGTYNFVPSNFYHELDKLGLSYTMTDARNIFNPKPRESR